MRITFILTITGQFGLDGCNSELTTPIGRIFLNRLLIPEFKGLG